MSSSVSKRAMAEDQHQEQTLTAVVIADSFDQRCQPVTQSLPRCLLPLANRPLLGYTLDFLRLSGFQQVYVYCCAHAAQVKAFLKKEGWTADEGHEDETAANAVQVTAISNDECHSLGDAMRDLDGKGVIRGDFALVAGDTVANVDLRPLLKSHAARRVDADKNATMTLLYRRAAAGHHCRTAGDDVVLALDAASGRILHHHRTNPAETRFQIPMEVFELSDEVDVCYDALDSGVAICSQEVPLLFADNFDCQTLDQFVQGVIENDLVDNTFYAHMLVKGYAARVNNLHNYLAVNKDVLARWLFPMTPDSAVANVPSGYRMQRHNVYKRADIQLGNGSLLERNVVLGPRSRVAEAAVLANVSVGADVTVEKGVSLRDCIVMDGATVGPNCQVLGAVIGPKAVIGAGSVVPSRCVIGEAVELPANTPLKEGTRLVAKLEDDGFGDEEELRADNAGDYGPKAFIYQDDESEDEDEEKEDAGDRNAALVARLLWGITLEDQHELDEGNNRDETASEASSDFSAMDEAAIGDILDNEEAKRSVFYNEVLESLQRGAKENVDPANLTVEINSSRHAYAATWPMVIYSVTMSLLHIALHAEDGLTGPKLLKEVKKVLNQFSDLLRTYCKSASTELDCLYAVEAFSAENEANFAAIAKNTMHLLYDADVVSESSVIEWYGGGGRDQRANEHQYAVGDADFARRLRVKVKPLIDWLQEEDEEDSDE